MNGFVLVLMPLLSCPLFRIFPFLVTLVIVGHCLAYKTNATCQLQGTQIYILGVLQEIECPKQSLQNVRDCIDTYHSCWYKEAYQLAAKVDCTSDASQTL